MRAFLIFVLLSGALRVCAAALNADDVKSGRETFAGACSACHGINGEGGHGPSLTRGNAIRRLNDAELSRTIQRGVPGTDMTGFPFPAPKMAQVVAFLRSLTAPAVETGAPGDVSAGSEIYHGKGGCAGCHMIRGKGGFPGPDLSEIGGQRTVAQLRQAVLHPEARPHPGYRGVTARLRDGSEIQGVAKDYTNYSLSVLDARGQLHLLATGDIDKVTFHDKPLMPDDYGSRLTAQEVDNLIAFLSRQALSQRKRK
jgi:putative heme-binding domain-containing protein